MSNVKTWAAAVGFRDVGSNAYRGYIHTSHLASVQKALREMGFTQACERPQFEIWSTENDIEVVMINHGGVEPVQIIGTQNLKVELEKLVSDGYKLFMSTAHEEAKNYPDALDTRTAAALAADGFTIYADKSQSMMRVKRGNNRAEDLSWTFTIMSMEGR